MKGRAGKRSPTMQINRKGRKNMKKLMSLLIALCLVLGLVPAMADGLEAVLAGEDTPVGQDFACVIDENNNVYWQLAVSSFDRLSEQVPQGKKSLSYKMIMRKKDSTLTDEEADASVAKVLKALEAAGVTLR